MSAGVPLRKRWVTDEMTVTSETGAEVVAEDGAREDGAREHGGIRTECDARREEDRHGGEKRADGRAVAAAIREEARSTKTVKAWPVRWSIPPREDEPVGDARGLHHGGEDARGDQDEHDRARQLGRGPRTAAFQYSDGDFARSEPRRA